MTLPSYKMPPSVQTYIEWAERAERDAGDQRALARLSESAAFREQALAAADRLERHAREWREKAAGI